jgi:hypothetical protein
MTPTTNKDDPTHHSISLNVFIIIIFNVNTNIPYNIHILYQLIIFIIVIVLHSRGFTTQDLRDVKFGITTTSMTTIQPCTEDTFHYV